MPAKLPAGFGGVGGGENGGDGADARRSGLEDFAYVVQVDSPYGKPGDRDVRRRPTHVVQAHGRDPWLGRRGINGSYGNVSRAASQGAERLRGRMAAEAQRRDGRLVLS